MTVTPTDDAGASTADRYDWQAAMAAADGLALYLHALDSDGQLSAARNCRIVCERHEDWAAMQADDAELISAKHREPSFGAYTTVNQLVGDGGLAHLFTRWHALGEKPTCRLVTTAGLAPGDPQSLDTAATGLRDQRLAGSEVSVDGDHQPAITRFAQALLKHCEGLSKIWQASSINGSTPTVPQREQAARFLSMLTIQHGQPRRAHIGYAAPAMYAQPVVDRLGCRTPPDAIWEAVLALFRARMRAAGPIPTGALPKVLAYRPGTPLPGPDDIERDLVARIVTLTDIDIAIRTAIVNPGGYLPLARVVRTSRVAIKMTTGLCSDNSVERAEQLRLDYQNYWRTRVNSDPTARADQERLRRLLLRISDNATTSAAKSTDAWGQALWKDLQARIDAMIAGQLPEEMDADLLLGGICDLANRCQVWFSDRFDVNAEIARLRAKRGTTP